MWNLDLKKYSPVYLARTPITPWIVNEKFMPQLKANAAFVKQLIEAYPHKKRGVMNWIKSAFHSPAEATEEIDVLNFLGLKTIGTLGGAFVDQHDFDQWIAVAEIALPTERFYSKPFLSLGSSRHVLLQDVQLKGVGRNNLCIDQDFYHSWGGLVMRDALKGYLSSLVANKKTKLGCLNILGLFNYSEVPAGSPPLTLVVRESNSFRLCQIDSSFLTDTDIKVVKTFLTKSFPGLAPQEMLEKILDHYIHAYSVGVVHRSPNKENLLIDGRWIDTESIDFKMDSSALYPFVKIVVPCSDEDLPNNFGKTFAEVAQGEQGILFYDSWIHHLYFMCELTFETYQTLWPEDIHGLNDCFWKIMRTYFSSETIDQWKTQTFHFISNNQIQFTSRSQDQLDTFDQILELAPTCKDYKCIGHHYDPTLGGMVYTFAEAEEDVHLTVNKILRKWEISFWPDEKNWQEAFDQARKATATIDEIIL